MINTEYMIAKKPSQRDLHIMIKNVYGAIKAYPVCAHAEIFASIAGTKTLTYRTLNHAHRLGYCFMSIDSTTGTESSISLETLWSILS